MQREGESVLIWSEDEARFRDEEELQPSVSGVVSVEDEEESTGNETKKITSKGSYAKRNFFQNLIYMVS